MASLQNLTELLLASLDDVTRVASLLNTTMQQASHPAFELSLDGVIWYLNHAASEAIGVTPQQAVGTRLTTYVADGLMTQRRIDALSQKNQAQSWPDAWLRGHDHIPCRLTGFAIPRALGSERPRVIVWSTPPETHETEKPLADEGNHLVDTLIPADRYVLGSDLDPVRLKTKKGVNRFCELIGIASVTWYAWRRNETTPIPNRTVALHLRLLDVMPDLALPGVQPADLQETLRSHRGIEILFTDLALLMGIERRSGYLWSHGNLAGDQIQALTDTLLRMLLEKPRGAWETYRELVDHQARIEQVDLSDKKSWMTATSKRHKEEGTLLDTLPRAAKVGRPRKNPPKSPRQK